MGHDSIPQLAGTETKKWYDSINQRKAILEGVFSEVHEIARWNRSDAEQADLVGDDVLEEEEMEEPEGEQGVQSKQVSSAESGKQLSGTLERLDLGSSTSAVTADRPRRPPRVPVAEKIKTKGIPAVNNQEQEEQDVEAEPEPEPATIKVDKDAFWVLEIAFNASKDRAPGEIAWDAILHMMRAIGFGVQPTGGSAHTFMHHDTTVRPFWLHSPHNKGDLRKDQFWKFFNRMKRSYDWFVKENFELDD